MLVLSRRLDGCIEVIHSASGDRMLIMVLRLDPTSVRLGFHDEPRHFELNRVRHDGNREVEPASGPPPGDGTGPAFRSRGVDPVR